jgi:UDP-N-acetylglucosamine/UDP-N-acetylgalactosamine diphosphorylase
MRRVDTFLDERIHLLLDKGVKIVDERQVYLSDDLDIDRIMPGSIIFPGTRLIGKRTFVGKGAKVGTDGPAILIDSILGEEAEVASGFLKGAVLLRKAKAGANAHFRPGTILEEEASTAHTVGLKHTILMCYATLGSLINFCDALVSGGRSRKDHSEIGSGFIHFNYTPWGKHGDKATASLIGNVVEGVFLDQDRIFLGGVSGIAGPVKIGFGSFSVAGQIIRANIENNMLVSNLSKNIKRHWLFGTLDRLTKRSKLNIEYISQLIVLKHWYEDVRLKKEELMDSPECSKIPAKEGLFTLNLCINERVVKFNDFSLERHGKALGNVAFNLPHCPLNIEETDYRLEYTEWVKSLSSKDISILKKWLLNISNIAEKELIQQVN